MSTFFVSWISLLIGCFFGMLIMSLMAIAGREDDNDDN